MVMTDGSSDEETTAKKMYKSVKSPVKNLPKVSSQVKMYTSSSSSDSDSSDSSKPTTTKSHNQSFPDLKKSKKKINTEKVTDSNEDRTSKMNKSIKSPVKNLQKVSSKVKSSSSSDSDSDSSTSSKPLPSKSQNQNLDSKKTKKKYLQSSDSTKLSKKPSQKVFV